MNAVGIPNGLSDTQMAVVLQRRRLNEEFLLEHFNGYEMVSLEGEPAARVYLHGSGLLFPSTMLNIPRPRFIAALDVMVAEAVRALSAEISTVRAPVPEVSATFGRQYILSKTRLAEMESPPVCSICLESLIPEGSSKKKVWQLHGEQCTYHVGCIRNEAGQFDPQA